MQTTTQRKTTKRKTAEAVPERICIARNEARETQMKADIESIFTRSTKLVAAYGQLVESHKLPPLANDLDLHSLHQSPVEFAKKRFKESVEVPAGMSRDAYFKLLDLSPIEDAFEGLEAVGPWYAGLLTLSKGEVKVNESVAQNLIESGNKYLQSGTAKHAAYEKLRELIKAANELNAMSNGAIIHSTVNPQFSLDQVADREFNKRPVTYRLDPSKTLRLLERVREHDDI